MTIFNTEPFIVIGSFFFLSIIFSLLINKLFLNFVKTLGMRNRDGTVIRWGSQAKPALGGFSFYVIYLLSIISFSIFFDINKVFLNKEFIGVLLATMLGFLLGLTDDAFDTRPLLKLAAQITCGIIMVLTGSIIKISSFDPLNYFITVFWVVGIMNSLNMLDNMDIIAGLVSVAILLCFLAIIFFHQDFENVFFMSIIGVMAAIIGFLYYNWHPSKMYMGDTGSQFLGVFLAAMGIRYLWNAETLSGDFISAKNILLPLLAFIIPITDTTTVVINRLRKKQSPFIGGKDHTTHALAYLGLSERQVALVFFAVSIVSLLLIIVMEYYLVNWSHTYTIIYLTYFLTILSSFYYISRIHRV